MKLSTDHTTLPERIPAQTVNDDEIFYSIRFDFFVRLKGFYSPSNLLPTEEVTASLIEKDNSENASQTNNSISQLSHVESAPVISTRENENSTMNDSDLVASRSLGKRNVRFVSRTFEEKK